MCVVLLTVVCCSYSNNDKVDVIKSTEAALGKKMFLMCIPVLIVDLLSGPGLAFPHQS